MHDIKIPGLQNLEKLKVAAEWCERYKNKERFVGAVSSSLLDKKRRLETLRRQISDLQAIEKSMMDQVTEQESKLQIVSQQLREGEDKYYKLQQLLDDVGHEVIERYEIVMKKLIEAKNELQTKDE